MDIPILIVDDQDDIRLLERLLIECGNNELAVVAEASSGPDAIDRMNDSDPLVVILDEMMPGMSGLETAVLMRKRRPAQIVILCSAHVDDALVDRARAVGVRDVISKDHLRVLPDLIRRAVGMAMRAGADRRPGPESAR